MLILVWYEGWKGRGSARAVTGSSRANGLTYDFGQKFKIFQCPFFIKIVHKIPFECVQDRKEGFLKYKKSIFLGPINAFFQMGSPTIFAENSNFF